MAPFGRVRVTSGRVSFGSYDEMENDITGDTGMFEHDQDAPVRTVEKPSGERVYAPWETLGDDGTRFGGDDLTDQQILGIVENSPRDFCTLSYLSVMSGRKVADVKELMLRAETEGLVRREVMLFREPSTDYWRWAAKDPTDDEKKTLFFRRLLRRPGLATGLPEPAGGGTGETVTDE